MLRFLRLRQNRLFRAVLPKLFLLQRTVFQVLSKIHRSKPARPVTFFGRLRFSRQKCRKSLRQLHGKTASLPKTSLKFKNPINTNFCLQRASAAYSSFSPLRMLQLSTSDETRPFMVESLDVIDIGHLPPSITPPMVAPPNV